VWVKRFKSGVIQGGDLVGLQLPVNVVSRYVLILMLTEMLYPSSSIVMMKQQYPYRFFINVGVAYWPLQNVLQVYVV
jgi:hypothetical protein